MSRFLFAVMLFLISTSGAALPQATPLPQPTLPPIPTPTPTTLPIIGHTRSQRYCSLELNRTNGAIVVALTNDKIIAGGIGRLRAADLDRPQLTVIDREKVMHDLRAIAAAIQTNLRAGDAETGDLRQLSIKEPDSARSPELKLLADQLDDTFARQRTVGSDLAKMLTIVEGRHAGQEGGVAAAAVMPPTQAEHATDGLAPINQRAAYEPLNQLFSDVADEFSTRTTAIAASEDAASVHAPKAVKGC